MGKRSVNVVRGVSKAILDAAVKVDDVVADLRQSGVHKVLRRDAAAAFDDRAESAAVGHSPSAYPSPIGILRNTFDPRIPGATKRQYRRARPWVQPSPYIPDRLAQTVLHVCEEEVSEFMDVVVSRYIRTLHTYWIKAAAYALKHPAAEPVSDAEFARILAETPISRFLCRTLDPVDREAFGALLDASKLESGRYAKIDFSNIDRLSPRPGIFVAPTVTLLERGSAGWTPLAIRINGLTVEPRHANAYELAKYFVLQGGANSLITGIHPNIHFPMDAVNALTRSLLPEDHPVRLLIEPHCYLQLPLNYAVLYVDKSVLKNDQREIYTPLVGPFSGILEFIGDFHHGVPGNSAMPAYRYGLEALDVPSSYGDFLKAYFEVILAFTTRVARVVPKDDPHVRRWSEHLARVVSGFPGPDAIGQGDTLARAVAFFIWNVSVLHTADHRGYAEQPINVMPLRVRVPPPTSLDMPPIDRSRVLRKEDVFRYRMARVMYFKPTVVRRLVDVEYGFEEEDLQDAVRRLKRGLREVDANPIMRRRCPLEEIACSIQF